MQHVVMYRLNCTEEFVAFLHIKNNDPRTTKEVAMTCAQIKIVLTGGTWKKKINWVG